MGKEKQGIFHAWRDEQLQESWSASHSNQKYTVETKEGQGQNPFWLNFVFVLLLCSTVRFPSSIVVWLVKSISGDQPAPWQIDSEDNNLQN